MLYNDGGSYRFFQDIDNLEIFLSFNTFFLMTILASCITILEAAEKVTMGEIDAGFSLSGSYLSNQTFLGVAYSFFPSIC